MKLITLYLNLHESPCLSVQSKLFGITSVIVDYLWRIILWKPWHDNVEDHHLWTLAAEEEEVIWTKSKRTAESAEFFGKPSLTHSIYVQSTTLTWHQGWYFAKQQNGSTNRHRDRVGANLFYWQTGCGSNRKLYSVEILNRQCQSWSVVEAAPTMEGILLRGNLFKSLSSLVKLWGFFAAKFWSFLGGKNCSIQEIDF